MIKKEWFESWFDTKYYHTLYKDRDDSEAENFINNLIDYLSPKSPETFLDLACGKGRHSFHIAEKGFETYGCDLSKESILHAQSFSKENPQFFVHDMRNELPKSYDYILNLFTSFGYFEDLNDNSKVLKSIKKGLNKDGTLIIDFLNPQFVIDNLNASEVKSVDGIDFKISRKTDSSHVTKTIEFEDVEQSYSFQERVQLLRLEDFNFLCSENGLKIKNTFGDYELNSYDEKNSKRLILEIINE